MNVGGVVMDQAQAFLVVEHVEDGRGRVLELLI